MTFSPDLKTIVRLSVRISLIAILAAQVVYSVFEMSQAIFSMFSSENAQESGLARLVQHALEVIIFSPLIYFLIKKTRAVVTVAGEGAKKAVHYPRLFIRYFTWLAILPNIFRAIILLTFTSSELSYYVPKVILIVMAVIFFLAAPPFLMMLSLYYSPVAALMEAMTQDKHFDDSMLPQDAIGMFAALGFYGIASACISYVHYREARD